jgi:hypothetical protein
MKAQTTNWAETFMYHENLSDTAQQISDLYMHIRRENPSHPDRDIWTTNIMRWADYKRTTLAQLVLPTEEDAKAEVEKLSQVYQEARSLQEILKKRYPPVRVSA